MVDVGGKSTTRRVAVASAIVEVGAQVLRLIAKRKMPKGDVFAVARIAGIAAAKRTAELIPLCHSLPLEKVALTLQPVSERELRIEATVRTHAKTGVEMEALTAISVAALTVYDMCKAVDRGMVIGAIQLEEKSGGRSGHFQRAAD